MASFVVSFTHSASSTSGTQASVGSTIQEKYHTEMLGRRAACQDSTTRPRPNAINSRDWPEMIYLPHIDTLTRSSVRHAYCRLIGKSIPPSSSTPVPIVFKACRVMASIHSGDICGFISATSSISAARAAGCVFSRHCKTCAALISDKLWASTHSEDLCGSISASISVFRPRPQDRANYLHLRDVCSRALCRIKLATWSAVVLALLDEATQLPVLTQLRALSGIRYLSYDLPLTAPTRPSFDCVAASYSNRRSRVDAAHPSTSTVRRPNDGFAQLNQRVHSPLILPNRATCLPSSEKRRYAEPYLGYPYPLQHKA
ncbi:hypothetical protein B0H17DRAFT_326506 [Mycena rosella]|uniref:Uncharacterized protein n=1 Tax=Mycena rosella TaxID=1033263 RepID=A0AAD7DV78_MYCRO|nr:hypothetical protein B0H17DRAFT_326506 [Mycena rosella]